MCVCTAQTILRLYGSSSNFLLHRFSLKTLPKFIYKWGQGFEAPILKFAAFSSIAASRVFDAIPAAENLQKILAISSGTKKTCIFQSNSLREISLSSGTDHLKIIDECLQLVSLQDAKKFKAKILKLGLQEDNRIFNELVEVYTDAGKIDPGLQILDDFAASSNLSSWNQLIFLFIRKKMYNQVFSLFSWMFSKGVTPDESAVATVFQVCSGGRDGFHFVRQIHAKFIHLGLSKSPLICNPLIDLYSKNGFVDYAMQIFEKMHTRDSVSWVAIISGFSRNSRELEGILLYSEMRKSGVFPTPYVFSSIISACTKIELFGLGEQLHCLIIKWGFSSELFVCNALLTLYSRYGNLTSAELIFSEMQCKDKVSYNTLISGLAMQGSSHKSLHLFEKMQSECLKPDSVTVASLLSACTSFGALHKGTQLHSYAIKAGMCSDIIIEGSLLDLYVKCSDVKTSREFFLSTQMDNVVLWNVMLVAYGQMGDLHESFHVFSQMLIRGLEPNQYTYPSILRTCTSVGALYLGEQLHNQVIKTGFHSNVYVGSVLIDMYAKHGKLDSAMKIFRRLDEEDVVSWTAMLSGYAQHDLFMEALKMFQEMQDHRIRSDNIGLASAISACAGIQAFNQGRQIHAQSIVSGYSLDLSVGNALVTFYSKCGNMQYTYSAFDKIYAKDDISWNGLISGLAQSGQYEEALKVFCRMIQGGKEANVYTYGSVISASANTTNIKQGKQIHARIINTGYDTEIEVSNALITLYAKCGSLDNAWRVFFEMPLKNEVSWNAMITGYSQHGYGSKAIELFEDMKKMRVMPTHITYVGVLTACSHVGLVEEGFTYFKSMKEEHGLVPKPEHYACVVDILGRAGQVRRAREFVDSMPTDPDAMVWRTLLSACTVHKNMEIGEFAAKNLLKLEPKDSATYVLLSNMYANAGKWGGRDCTRQLMKYRGVKKEPGRSWIEVKNSIHAFFVGDHLHPLADQIYEFLEDLTKQAVAIGYVQDSSSLWNDLELGQKDPTAHVHSEKLAIAFGLLTLPNIIPLRVMKNLRVCKDCHNWIKFVSKIFTRTIVVRDAYRFHHFKDGDCSCRDYW
ncbi:pentatricopeptide repeat-containing protein At4g13650 [Olea europaea var. sylvestris]|uniref:pentatricopeptide repeat-containing protein At4g13650 n=1 Tax=Olea europaea var. sylvestris TaxID=158386 RepID=UPI000C1D7690|nr:pentatricopeptide repeat-containing protein At4g13650 [Olea europaea var. sylvestris]XP_022882556.1 pentatricopeptide repeat-containing protein At4g13650 [Olea europaea var. sylvestris]XP_022882557.1 pentatricopeptide repeat-containing protein At4g13650 [Olea europaea var. sylvestris]XP_022882558.1 pentatricopeptide repeat-containing protein At4g13650 [Olea europaea var. sylvestris]XP_022882559.1 pentatricopeptide repeat-containing protein At4g13650 [Olea europaea var. sylvestris]XP_0228825